MEEPGRGELEAVRPAGTDLNVSLLILHMFGHLTHICTSFDQSPELEWQPLNFAQVHGFRSELNLDTSRGSFMTTMVSEARL